MKKYRLEKDTLGHVNVPSKVYFGAQTQRAIDNFPISGLLPHKEYIYSTVIIKKAAAEVNAKLDQLDKNKSQAIIKTCDEILSGKFLDQFQVDVYQAGAGTSHNMNVNEVIANRANQILGAPLGSYQYIHPNDHVNMSQSTNDVIPAAIRIAVLTVLPKLTTNLKASEDMFFRKSREFNHILKSGRTHLQDALPLTLGQEFSAYAKAVNTDRLRIKNACHSLLSIGIGGTAVGTGINSHKYYHQLMIAVLSSLTKLPLISSKNLFDSMQNTADLLAVSSSFKILAQTLIRIGNDLRIMSSGPRTGLSELILPEVQPGSSIMPAKVNPSIVEMLTMVCFQVIGYDQAILFASSAGQLELNVMSPLIAYNLLEQIKLFTNAISVFNKKCLSGIKANRRMCQYWFDRTNSVATILSPYLWYEKTAELIKLAFKNNCPVKEIAIKKGYLTKKQAEEFFSVKNIISPNINAKQMKIKEHGDL